MNLNTIAKLQTYDKKENDIFVKIVIEMWNKPVEAVLTMETLSNETCENCDETWGIKRDQWHEMG